MIERRFLFDVRTAVEETRGEVLVRPYMQRVVAVEERVCKVEVRKEQVVYCADQAPKVKVCCW